MRFTDITPVILTYNEAPNIARTLAPLAWAKDVVVVDSDSTDETRQILGRFPAVRVFPRKFDGHARQWQFAIDETGIATPWVLGLDADLVLTDELAAELESVDPALDIGGYRARVRYCIHGHALRDSIYPPRVILFRREGAKFFQDGHTQRLAPAGRVDSLRHFILHDDRKSIRHWIRAQDRYARLERDKLLATPRAELGPADRLRLWGWLAPFAVLFYCLFYKGLILNGFPGWYYTTQRVIAELLLSLYLIEARLGKTSTTTSQDGPSRNEK